MSTPDATDERLVRLLGQDARQNSEKLAKKLNLSAATVRRRMRKLLRSGLLRIVGVVDAASFGFPLVAVISVDVAPDKLESVQDALGKQPEIRWTSTTTGRFDVIAVGQFRSNDSLSQFLIKKVAKIEGVKDSETFICLRVQKGTHVSLI